MGFYDYSVKNAQGEDVSMKQFEGKVVIVVNTATGCGFTPHYSVQPVHGTDAGNRRGDSRVLPASLQHTVPADEKV